VNPVRLMLLLTTGRHVQLLLCALYVHNHYKS